MTITVNAPSGLRDSLPRAACIAAPIVLVLFALAIRIPLYSFVSGDYSSFVSNWYDHLKAAGFAGLADNFSNYNPPYLYLLWVATVVPVSKIVAIKSISVLFDLLLAFFAYKLVALRRNGWLPALAAAGAILLAPTVVLNGAEWAQCDSIYASLCLGSTYFLLKRRPYWAATLFGLAVAFKLQAVFFAPIAVIILPVQREQIRRVILPILLVPLVFVAMLVPALLAGASLSDLLNIYPNQISSGGVNAVIGGGGSGAPGGGGFGGFGGAGSGARGGGFAGTGLGGGNTAQYRSGLTDNASNFYQWLPVNAGSGWKYLGLALTAVAVASAGLLANLRRTRMTLANVMLLASTLLIAIPFFLPSMHDRYFFLADVFTIVTSFLVSRYWPVAALIQISSLVAYAAYLWNGTMPLWVGATATVLALAWSTYLLIKSTSRTGVAGTAGLPPLEREPENPLHWPAAQLS